MEFEAGITIVCGPMFAGKTSEFLRRLRREDFCKRKIQVFRPFVDQRYALDRISSHDGVYRLGCTFVASSKDVREMTRDSTDCVAVEEVQFFDEGIIEVLKDLATSGKTVICSGLDMDFRGLPFGPMGALLAIADDVVKLRAVCTVCHSPSATLTQRLINGHPAHPSDPIVLVGGSNAYEARCRRCYMVGEAPSELPSPPKGGEGAAATDESEGEVEGAAAPSKTAATAAAADAAKGDAVAEGDARFAGDGGVGAEATVEDATASTPEPSAGRRSGRALASSASTTSTPSSRGGAAGGSSGSSESGRAGLTILLEGGGSSVAGSTTSSRRRACFAKCGAVGEATDGERCTGACGGVAASGSEEGSGDEGAAAEEKQVAPTSTTRAAFSPLPVNVKTGATGKGGAPLGTLGAVAADSKGVAAPPCTPPRRVSDVGVDAVSGRSPVGGRRCVVKMTPKREAREQSSTVDGAGKVAALRCAGTVDEVPAEALNPPLRVRVGLKAGE